MSDDALFPDSGTDLGRRIDERLRDDRVLWLTVVAPSGTPQPTPVWFVRSGDDIVVYNDRHAKRLDWMEKNPRVALHLNSDGDGGDFVVLTGRAEIREDVPGPDESPGYLAKYGDEMTRIMGSPGAFAQQYSVAAVIHVDHVRGAAPEPA
ncbi:TIGR03667 family PPOX class F420-dependent oxidoreductase [Jiangella mangrovi]|uniref:PPOX class probable F420-dependent enzyme n=1 Tax=Jiangella mangrovi TaxID=1524084 RepID=A0A7W9GVE3_9ACTN|nr:TIGR03667 family PPOX class F420-dependent oxidoreductase [Jiangella mangrovi]MBB5790441.1 PPOX class probable F420-dependent enzyme [Jiangella mangrovi]